jgi:general nucleoside transport system permease protein
MLMAAFGGGGRGYLTGSVWIGLLAGMRRSMLLALVHGLASITFRGNQLISGVAINFLASGHHGADRAELVRQGGRTPPLAGRRGSSHRPALRRDAGACRSSGRSMPR